MKKRITILEIIVIAFLLAIFALYLSPRFMHSQQELKEATLRANTSIAVSAVKSTFAIKTKSNMTKIAETVAETLNKSTKNPYDKKNKAFTVNSPITGAVNLEPDDSKELIKVNGYVVRK